jgi:hypothetical protein
VNIPGLADVTPQQIQTINDYLLNLQNQIDVLATTQVRQGIISGLVVGDQTITITFATAMPSDNYTVCFTPQATAGGATQAPIFAIQTGSQTISGFTVFIDENVATITNVEWVAIHSA